MSVNQCNFIGRLGQKPEVKYTQSGTAVCNFSIACTDRYKDKSGQQQESTEWITIVAWNRLAEICGEYLDKGSKVYISGKYTTRKWQDQNGNDRYSTEIIAREMQMLDSKQSTGGQGSQYEQSTGEAVPF